VHWATKRRLFGQHRRIHVLAAIALACTVLGSAPAWAQPADSALSPEAAACKALEAADFSGIVDAPTQITETKLIAASEELPAYCRVLGYVATHVGIEMRLPVAGWNGKFLEVGCGGFCGATGFFIQWFCDNPLRRGYACISSDMGHQSSTVEGVWAFHDLQAKVDWSYRATHVAALAGKAITEHFYSRAPTRSYFHGCSTGGRQGLIEAQRFPWDFDGIIAGAPGIDMVGIESNLAWDTSITRQADGTPLLSDADVQAVHEAVIAKCDLNDHIKDGLIGDPRLCKFDPSEMVCSSTKKTSCLTTAQAEIVRKIYSGPLNSRGEPIYMPAWLPGSELDWHHWFLSGADRKLAGGSAMSIDMFRYFAFLPDAGPTWKLSDMDYERDSKRLGMTEALYSGLNPDLRKFKAVGSKLLVYHGWSDAIVGPLTSIDYFETVEKTLGGRAATQDFFRLFMLPGVIHCETGEGASAIDYLSYLEAWVEQGKAPDMLLSAHLKDHQQGHSTKFPLDRGAIAFTRPVYPYPIATDYKGRGDPNDAASFGPVKP
jgi:hypothetical protein